MKLVNYRCEGCGDEESAIFSSNEEVPEVLGICHCGYDMVKYNYKNNSHRYRFCDSLED